MTSPQFLKRPCRPRDAIPAQARPFDLRWLPPIAVNLDDVGDLPATVRPVKP